MAIDWNLTDFRYSEHVTGLRLKSYFLPGGYDFQQRHPTSSRWTYAINMPAGYKAVIMSEHYISNPESGIFVDTGWFTIETLPNNYKIQIRFYLQYQSTTAFCQARFLSNTGTEIYNVQNVVTVSTINVNVSPAQGEIDTNVVMFYCVNTSYYPAVPVEAVTVPNSLLYITGLFGFLDKGFHVTAGDNYLNTLDTEGYSVNGNLISINIQNYDDWLHNNGDPFEGDSATKDPLPPPGPAGDDDTSEPGGGGGNYDNTSDPVDFPELPTGGAIECGAVIAHRVVKQTLEAIFTKLWNKSILDISNLWQKSIQDPMDAIVSLHALPVSPSVEPDPDPIAVGNLDMGVTSPKVTSQYVEVDCGTLELREFWGSALDYSPYTRVEIFLPFIGIRTLRTEDVMKSTLHIKYHIDVLSGDCIAFIKCGISVLYTYNGNCKMLIPLSSRSTDFLQKAAIAAGLAVGAGSVAVGGGAAAAAATKAPAVAAAGITQSAANLQAGSMLISGASNVASTKINTSRSGDISSALSLMADFVPYLIIHRPVQSLAKNYNKFKGYTSNITAILGDLTGYTEVEHVHLQNKPNATDAELAEIHSLLIGGVIL